MKKTISILLAITLLFSAFVLPVNAINVTDDDIAYYEGNIQRIKDYILNNGKKDGTYHYYIEKYETVDDYNKQAKMNYYSNTGELVFDMQSTLSFPLSHDDTYVTLYNICFDKKAYFKYKRVRYTYLDTSTAHSEDFNLVDFKMPHLLYFDELNGETDSFFWKQEEKQDPLKAFSNLESIAISWWNRMLDDIFGFELQGIGMGATFEEHRPIRNGSCNLCGKKIIDVSNCSCICHKDKAFYKPIYRFLLFFWELFGIREKCKCGTYHYWH